MRTSCNGCRVLRKGCSEDCTIRPCLQWIKSPDSQSNATLFLAKFFGRAGLLNLLSSASPPLRPAVFKSLLYEACGRVVDPVYGAVGLMWSGQWHHCHAAVDAVLKGQPISPLPSSAAAAPPHPPPKLYDIRHVSPLVDPTEPLRTRTRTARKAQPGAVPTGSESNESVFSTTEGEADPELDGLTGNSDETDMSMDLELTLGLNFNHGWVG